jgi:hypothetical protein
MKYSTKVMTPMFNDIEEIQAKILKKCDKKYKIPRAEGQAEKEADLLHDILAMYKQEPAVFIQRIDGVGKLMHGKMIPSSHAGFPDLIMIIQGKFFGIELKAKGGSLSEKQRDMLQNMQRAGANVGIVLSTKGLNGMISGVQPDNIVENIGVWW